MFLFQDFEPRLVANTQNCFKNMENDFSLFPFASEDLGARDSSSSGCTVPHQPARSPHPASKQGESGDILLAGLLTFLPLSFAFLSFILP